MSLSLLSQITFLNLFQNDMLKNGQRKFSNPLYSGGLDAVVKCRICCELWAPPRHFWWTKGAGCGKGSSSVWEDLVHAVISKLKCLEWSIFFFSWLFYSTILIFYSLYSKSSVCSTLHPMYCNLSSTNGVENWVSGLEVSNQCEKWVCRTLQFGFSFKTLHLKKLWCFRLTTISLSKRSAKKLFLLCSCMKVYIFCI